MINRLVANNRTLDLSDEIPTPVNYSVADLLEPDKRTRNFSKKIELEGTINNLAFFQSAFSFSTSNNLASFDPTVKVPCQLYKRDNKVVDGVLQLNKVSYLDDKYTFTVTLFSEITNAFLRLKNTTINELDWTAYTHTLTQANIAASWLTPDGSGYRYVLDERGSGRPGPLIWRVTDLVPRVHLIEIFNKCLELAEVPYTSTFLGSDRVTKILCGDGGGQIPGLTPQDITDRLVDVDSGDFNNTEITSPILTQQNLYEAVFNAVNIDANTFTEVVTQDNLGQYADGTFTIAVTGNYTFTVGMVLDYAYNVGSLGFLFAGAPKIKLIKNGNEIASSTTLAPTSNLLGQSNTVDYSFATNLFLHSGDQISLRVEPSFCRVDGFSNQVRLDITTNGNITIDLATIDTALTDGSTIEIARFLPAMKCSEFFLGFLRQFQLFVSEPDDTGVVRIEPLVDFYKPTTDFDDITKLIDYSKAFEQEPTGNLYPKTTSFQFKKMPEHDAREYAQKWDSEYGDYLHENNSDYATGEKKINLPWATIIPYNIGQGVLVPRFITIDDSGAAKPVKGPLRIMYWQGLKDGDWSLRNITVPWNQSNRTQYPAVHHFDDYEDPEFDLNYLLVRELFYTTGDWVSVNSYSEYYFPFINEITAPSGELVTCYVKYNATQIQDMDFAKLKMINGKLFRLNKIFDFDDNIQPTTKVELLKVLDAKNSARKPLFVPPRDQSVGTGTSTSPSGVGDDVGLMTGGNNSPNSNSNLMQG